ncbi:hypothetical protein [Halorhodospira halochloris]|uniref:hypothetical protein n=1 Tax=Halorhodospira halochloris TaxID=1052 RepID=UPI001EE8D813|nr:hypothetical protein [Halorhodospira halochloris]MCG5548725.1 hypothetical protein [Halorhodospira halochloris]
METTWPLWLITAAALATIELAASDRDRRARGVSLSIAVGAVVAALVSFAGLSLAVEAVVAALAAAFAYLLMPQILPRLDARRQQPVSGEILNVRIDVNGLPFIEREEGVPIPAALEDRGELEMGAAVRLVRIEDGVALVRMVGPSSGRKPPPLSACRLKR